MVCAISNQIEFQIRVLIDRFVLSTILFSATIRVLVDGGANEWFKFIDKNEMNQLVSAPDFSIGDMDSITEESIQRLNAMKCQRIYAPDQNDTDCTKSVISIRPYLKAQKV